ncbi:MAG: RecBCD enzyme subunit, partial [Pseudomonadota bacterium]
NEAGEIRAALSARGVRSVYLSESESVFDTDEAIDLGRWLAACAEPDDGRLLRAALATPTLALDLAELDRLNHDERAWEARVLQFRGYRECWRRQGVLPMVRRLLHDFQVPERLLAGNGPNALPEAAGGRAVLPAPALSRAPVNGERVLTNLLHLAELLQQASVLIDGEHGLIRHLAEQRGAGEGRSDVRQVRLESDANLVQVVTVHKSKGLEYPLVFLPFACAYRETKPDDLPLKWHDDAGRLQLALEPNELALQRADRERLAEDLRKLYVALTRARHATWVGVAPVDGLERSALGYLMTGGAAATGDAVEPLLQSLRGDCPHVLVEQAPEARDEAFDARASTTLRLEARTPVRSPHRPWWIASYSAIAHGGARQVGAEPAAEPAAETPKEDTFRESHEVVPPPSARPSTPRRSPLAEAPGLHDFPRGADAGTFLHDLLEWAATQGFDTVVSDPGPLRDTIARRCALRGWSQWIDPLTAWVRRFLAIPFTPAPIDGVPQAPFRLQRIGAAIPEMEFWISASEVDLALLDREIRAGTLGGASRPPIDAGRINGMLKGFIDLVFEHDGRYYVADYKSNRLGDDDAAYTPDAMAASVLQERYDLQYVLYLLALHRLLRARLPDYDYDRHVGGAVYLYLRGADAPGHGVHAERPPKALIEALDRLFARASAKEAA